LWSDSTIGSIHWESPVVANGTLYISDENNDMTAYNLGATAARVMWFHVRRRGGSTGFGWRIADGTTIAGYYITAHHRRLNAALIPRHQSSTYMYRLPRITAGPYNLYAVLLNGKSERIARASRA
jgi:hypothetical protein